MAGFKKLGVKGNVVHNVVFPGPTRRASYRRNAPSGAGLRGRSFGPSEGEGPPATGASLRAVRPVAEPAPAPVEARQSPGEARQSKRETDLLQRRIEKLSRLLTEQEEQIRSLADRGVEVEAPAPIYGVVKATDSSTVPVEKRRAFMSQLFQANLELRESVNRAGS